MKDFMSGFRIVWHLEFLGFASAIVIPAALIALAAVALDWMCSHG